MLRVYLLPFMGMVLVSFGMAQDRDEQRWENVDSLLPHQRDLTIGVVVGALAGVALGAVAGLTRASFKTDIQTYAFMRVEMTIEGDEKSLREISD
jgi:hypothetical protein